MDSVRLRFVKRNESTILFASFLVLNVLFFRNALSHNFFWWDDVSFLIEANQGFSSLSHPHMGHYLPGFRLVMLGLFGAFGLHHAYYEVIQIAFQALNGSLLYLLLTRNSDDSKLAALFSIFFCFAPVNVETVIWMCVLSQMLTATFFLLSLLSHKQTSLSTVCLFVSFTCFGGGVVLSVPYIAYSAVRRSWRSVFGASVAVAVFFMIKSHAVSAIPSTTIAILDIKAWLRGIEATANQIYLLNNVNPLLIVVCALVASYIFYSRQLRIRMRQLMQDSITPIVLFSTYGIAAYLVRGVVAARHLYLPLLAGLWLLSALIHNCTTMRKGRRQWLGRGLVAAGLVFMLLPLSHYADLQIGAWSATRGRPAEGFTEDLRTVLNRQQSGTLYETRLISPLLSHATLSQYIPLLGIDPERFMIVSDPYMGGNPGGLSALEESSHYKNLQFWINQFPEDAAKARPFYLKYYPISVSIKAPNLLQNGGFEDSFSHWECSSCSISLSVNSHGGAFAAATQFPHGGMLFQNVKLLSPREFANRTLWFHALVRTAVPNAVVARLAIKNSSNTQILQMGSSKPHSGSDNYEVLGVSAIVPSDAGIIGVDIASVNRAVTVHATIDDVQLTAGNTP